MDIMDYVVLLLSMKLIVASIQANSIVYVGCFIDIKGWRTLLYVRNLNPNGAHYCSAVCRQKGYRYAGTQYGTICLCGNQIIRKTFRQTSISECNTMCTNNEQEMCGGRLRISIYDILPNPTGYLGCYNDRNNHRTLSGTKDDLHPNGASYCTTFCLQKGYRYAGTEYSYECHCGNTIRGEATSITECNARCSNNRKERCGGSNRISIYDTWQTSTITAPPTTTTTTATPSTTTTTSATPSTTTTTSATPLPTTTDVVDISETTFNSIASSTNLYDKLTDTDDKSDMTTYICIASGVVVVVIVVVVVLLLYRRRKTKANSHDTNVLHKKQTTNQAVNDEPNNISFIDVNRSSRNTTLYDNEHVLMTADGEHVNIEFHATQSTADCDDYNTLCLSGKSAVTGFGSNARPNQRANESEDTYSHLNEHNIDQTSSDTYSRVTRNRLNDNDKSHLCDSTYSHIGQAATQSLALENVIAPDGIYNTLHTLPKRKDIKKNPSNYKDINNDNGDQFYSNNSSADAGKGVRINEGNYSHVLDSKLAQAQAMNNTSSDVDNIYAKVVKKPNSAHNSGKTKTGQSKPQYYIPENVDENIHEKDCFNDDQTYYNV